MAAGRRKRHTVPAKCETTFARVRAAVNTSACHVYIPGQDIDDRGHMPTYS